MASLKVVGILYSRPLFLVFFLSQCMLLTLLLIARFVCTRISKTRGMLSKARSYVTKKSLFFFFLVYPYLTYCNIIWSFTYPTNIINGMYTCCRKELFKQSVLQTTGPPVNPFFKNLGTSLFSKFISNWISQGFYQICQVISSSYLQNKHKKIYNLIPRTEILELFTSLNNQIKQHKNLQSDFT